MRIFDGTTPCDIRPIFSQRFQNKPDASIGVATVAQRPSEGLAVTDKLNIEQSVSKVYKRRFLQCFN